MLAYRRRKLIILIELILLAFISFNYIREKIKNQPLRHELNNLKSETVRLQKENLELRQRVLRLQNPENTKKEIKEKFNLSDPGEKVIILPEGW